MRNTFRRAPAAVFLLIVLQGCAGTNGNLQGHEGAAAGAGVGAVGGAIIGGITGGDQGVVVGGLLGALTGGILGDYHDRKERGLAETRQLHAEIPSSGETQLKIERIHASPAVADPGDTIEIRMTYAVLTPREDMPVHVREHREILFEGQRVGEASLDIEREGGTWRSTVPITLPKNARSGSYRVVASVELPGGGKDTEEVTFRVR